MDINNLDFDGVLFVIFFGFVLTTVILLCRKARLR